MAATPEHSDLDQDVQGIHVPFQFSFADETSRVGAPASRLTGGASKLALQRDTSALWLLFEASPTPTWASMGAGTPASVGQFSKTLSNTAWNNDAIPLWQAPRDGSATLVELLATTSGITDPKLSFNIQHRDWDAMQSAGTDLFGASQTATSAGEQFTSFARSTVDPRAHLLLTTGSAVEGGSVKYLQITGYYTL